MRKIAISLFLICFSSFTLSALDLRGALHVDNFAKSHSVGFSFFAEESITPYLAMRAQADYLRAKNYDVQTLIVGTVERFKLAGGFALKINDSASLAIAPGLGMLFGWQITKALGLEATALLYLTPSDLSKLYDLRAKILFTYNTRNANTTFSYKADKSFVSNDFINTLDLQVEALEPGFPVGLAVGTGLDLLINSEGFGFDVMVSGGLNVYAGKYGTYFAKTNLEVFSTTELQNIPYEVIVGARFSL